MVVSRASPVEMRLQPSARLRQAHWLFIFVSSFSALVVTAIPTSTATCDVTAAAAAASTTITTTPGALSCLKFAVEFWLDNVLFTFDFYEMSLVLCQILRSFVQ